ncbi:MAG: hypothetical protein M5U26_01310 [Planctomycetota bacterium]|nr:hypothetical protein [Planctomycetota bacterium]
MLFHPLNWLARFAPEERATMELMGRVRWRKENLPWAEPKNEAGAPEWAFWQREAFKDCKSIIHWIIDHRQVETGEFGGVWGDDTDMVEYWTDYVLSAEDPKISNALRRFWDGVYRDALRDGVSRTIRDNLHSYEEGMGCIAHQLLLDYGDPIAVEHTMRATSHLDKWMAKNEDGTYRFLSNYQGYGGVWTEGNFGKDESRNALMLIPGGYLVWYNRHPYPAKYISGWTLNRAGPGIVADASWFLSNDEAGRKAWYAGKAAEYLKAARYAHQTNCLFHHTPVEEEHKPLLLNFAAKNDFLKGNLPDYAGYSPSMTEHWWMAYMASGDAKYLVESYKQACRFINNQRWLYTEAQPSTDRIPLPKTTVIRARVGAFVTERGGHTNTWPMHGISYTKNGNEVAALVTENAEKAFTVRLYPFAGQPLPLQFRLWRLWPGRYKLTLSKDANDDGQPEEALETREVEVDRGCFQEVVLPPGACAILRLEALAAQPPVFDLPDPAIAARELVLEYGDHLHVTVHNLGTQPVKNLKVRIIDGFSGKIVEEKTIAQIPAALDLTPQTALLEFQNLNAYTKSFIRVELDPEKEQPDLNRYNNTAELKY